MKSKVAKNAAPGTTAAVVANDDHEFDAVDIGRHRKGVDAGRADVVSSDAGALDGELSTTHVPGDAQGLAR